MSEQPHKKWNWLTIDFFEHLPHAFDIIMVQEPSFAIFLIFFEGDSEGVGNIHGFSVILPEENTDDTLACCPSRCTGVVVCDGKKDKWVYDCMVLSECPFEGYSIFR